jgi:hypothetical protein
MNKITIGTKEYYSADEVYKTEPESFVGCSKTTRLIVKNKKLKPEEYVYMKYIKSRNEWEPSDETYKQAKLLITAEWVHNNLIKFKAEKTEEDLKIEAMRAPPVIELNDDEKFVDVNGNKLDIEVRGTKEMNNIYFKVIDVSNKFGLGDISIILLNPKSSFMKDLHYKLFKIPKLNKDEVVPNKNTRYLFLTFKGLTKLLYVSHSKNAEHFQDWANKILFTYQLGSKEDKLNLANKLLGCNINEARRTLNCNANKISTIYLITFGLVKDLRETFNIPESFKNDRIVVKYGRSDDLNRRLKEHQTNYSKLNNINVLLKLYSYVDYDLAAEAENNVKRFFNWGKYNLDHPEYKELAIVSSNDFDIIKKEYNIISNNYGGTSKEFIHKINMIEKECEIKLLQKDNEILQLKLQLATIKN